MGYELKREDILAFADFIGSQTKQVASELRFAYCPRCRGGSHKDKDTFAVNLESGAFKCLRASCDYHGHFVELARDFGFGLGTPKAFRQLPQRKIESKPEAVTYLESRGISRAVTERYRITVRRDNPAILAFPFCDENGTLQFVKYRNTKFNGKGNKEWCEKDTMPILFGMDRCQDSSELIICEGQIDSLSVSEAGIKNAVSVPNGALGFTWLAHCFEWIRKFESVVVFGDCEGGSVTLADTLRKRLPQRVKVVRVCDYLGEKDANDILRKYGAEAVRFAVEHAEVPPLRNVKCLSDVRAIDLNRLPKIRTGLREVDRVTGGLVYGQLILLTGKRGHGKSTFMSQLVCEALDQGESVFVYSGELTDYHFKRWLDLQLAGRDNLIQSTNEFGDCVYDIHPQALEKINEWYRGRAYIYDNAYLPETEGECETVLETIENVVRQYGCRLICIDNLMTAMDFTGDDENIYTAQSRFAGALKRIAAKYEAVVILVAHPRKTAFSSKNSRADFSNDEVSGSADITNKADLVMSYERMEDAGEEFDGRLHITKNRLLGRCAAGEKAVKLFYSSDTKRITSLASPRLRLYGWERNAGMQTSDSLEEIDGELPF